MPAKQAKSRDFCGFITLLSFDCPEVVLSQEAMCLWYRQPATELVGVLPVRITSAGKPVEATSLQAWVVEFETEPAGVYMLSAHK